MCSPQQIMKDRWINAGFEEDELKPFVEPELDITDQKRIGTAPQRNRSKLDVQGDHMGLYTEAYHIIVLKRRSHVVFVLLVSFIGTSFLSVSV